MHTKKSKGVISEWSSWDPRIIYSGEDASFHDDDELEDDEDDVDDYLIHGGEYEPEDRPDDDDDIPEFDD